MIKVVMSGLLRRGGRQLHRSHIETYSCYCGFRPLYYLDAAMASDLTAGCENDYHIRMLPSYCESVMKM